MKHSLWSAFVLFAVVAAGRAQDSGIILDMDSVRHRVGEMETPDKKKMPIGTAELVEGKFGKAVKFSFVEGARSAFMTASVQGSPAWDSAEGFSFWVKGDGSKNWGGIELIDRSNYSLRYACCFPIDSTEWKKIVVPWRDVIPELSGPLVGKDGYAPSGFGNFWLGKWYYWLEYPAHSYTIDQVALEKSIEQPPAPIGDGLKRTREKLAGKKPLTIVTMGDSLSDQRHWANRKTVWSTQLAERIKSKFGCEVKIVNPAMGGTTLSQNLILAPRWATSTPRPDLVTIWFGFNDWDSGVRGPRFREYLELGIDRVRRLTENSADILILTTCPAFARWDTMKELEDAARDVAKRKNAGLADIAAALRAAGSADEAMKRNYWAWDKTHLGTGGHRLAAETVLKAMEGEE